MSNLADQKWGLPLISELRSATGTEGSAAEWAEVAAAVLEGPGEDRETLRRKIDLAECVVSLRNTEWDDDTRVNIMRSGKGLNVEWPYGYDAVLANWVRRILIEEEDSNPTGKASIEVLRATHVLSWTEPTENVRLDPPKQIEVLGVPVTMILASVLEPDGWTFRKIYWVHRP